MPGEAWDEAVLHFDYEKWMATILECIILSSVDVSSAQFGPPIHGREDENEHIYPREQHQGFDLLPPEFLLREQE